MRGYRKRPGTQGFSVPLVGAFLFFIISLFLFASYKNSACQQAKKEIYSLYTANRAFDLDEVYQDGLTAIYAKEYGKTATAAGCEALEQTGRKTLAVAGGVAANSRIRAALQQETSARGVRLCMPPLSLCGDNGAMIGAQAYYEYLAGNIADQTLNAYATRSMEGEAL